jgi:hypothetical protein
VESFFRPSDQKETHQKVSSFLKKNELSTDAIDLVIMGYNGDAAYDEMYKHMEDDLFQGKTIAHYKHLSGEHDTSSAFAMWIAAKVLKDGRVPEVIVKTGDKLENINRVLIYNHFRNINHSLILLEKA